MRYLTIAVWFRGFSVPVPGRFATAMPPSQSLLGDLRRIAG
jgi:hypothetical protein